MIPVKFRRTGEAIQGNYDFFSTLGGVGYVSVYLAGGMIEVNTKEYFLTLDSSVISDQDNFYTAGNQDIDFDLLIGKPFRVKTGTAVMCAAIHVSGGGSTQVTWNIYHVAADTTETLIGTAIGDTYTSAAGISVRKTIQIAITGKSFKKGEKLRINAVVAGGAATEGLYYDPAGRTVGTITADTFLKLPVNLPI